jgi:nitrous oxide reductase
MKSIKDMTKEEQDEILSIASKISEERAKESKFQSLDDARIVMIRWDVPYSKYQCSYHSVNVSIDDVKKLVKMKIFGENNEK